MNIIETYELLKNNIGWNQPPDGSFVVDADNHTSTSGRWFQDEHTAITLKNIHATIEVENADNETLNLYLSNFTKQAIVHTVSNVFDDDIEIEGQTSIFDTAISLRMAILLLEMMLNSTRSNQTERELKATTKYFFDLNGGSGNPNFPNYTGIRQRYAEEIQRLRDKFNKGNTLDCFTLSIGTCKNDPTLL